MPVFISFVVFTISMFAETNRLPFDLPESETELVAGYHTEYSSMKFALFFLGEYTAMIAGCSVIVALFLGGWRRAVHSGETPKQLHAPCWGIFFGLIHITAFFAKVAALLIFFIWVRWTLPRFRFDQLMKLGWLYLFEIALVNIFLTAGILAFSINPWPTPSLVLSSPSPRRFICPSIVAGLMITLKHFKNMLTGQTKVVMQYPEEKWDSHMPEYYRGAPTLVTDEHGRERCVACQLCEFICPPRCIRITPGEIAGRKPSLPRWRNFPKSSIST